jgi:hypothetical protein
VYLKLGFVDEYRLIRMTTIVVPDKLDVSTARPVNDYDLPALIKFDSEIFGANRQQLLEWMWGGAPQYAFLVEDQNGIQGFCLGRHGYNFTHIGPVIAQNNDIAKELVSAALYNCTGQPVILDAMHFNPEWMTWLEAIGFKEQRHCICMYKGPNQFPGIPEKQFAIMGPEFG